MRFIVPGRPFGKARPRASRFGVYNPKSNKEYEEKVRISFKKAAGIIPELTDMPMYLNVEMVFPIPKGTSKRKREMMLAGSISPCIKPDMDNCLKSIMDALNGVAYKDDKQIVISRAIKYYGECAMTIIDIGRYYK